MTKTSHFQSPRREYCVNWLCLRVIQLDKILCIINTLIVIIHLCPSEGKVVIIINYCLYSQGKVVIIINYCLYSQGKVVIIIIDYCLSSQGKVVDHQEEAELKLVNELLSKAQRTRVKLLSKVYIYFVFFTFFLGGGGVRDPFTALHWKVGGWVAGGGGECYTRSLTPFLFCFESVLG